MDLVGWRRSAVSCKFNPRSLIQGAQSKDAESLMMMVLVITKKAVSIWTAVGYELCSQLPSPPTLSRYRRPKLVRPADLLRVGCGCLLGNKDIAVLH